MKEVISLMLGALMLLSLSACGTRSNQPEQLPDPFTEYDSMDEAEDATGFPLTVPETMNDYSKHTIRAMVGKDNMIEVIYCNDSEDDEATKENEIRIRKAVGNEDISGDYTDYTESSTVTVGNLLVSTKGENGKIRLATWSNGDYTYSIGFYFGTGISSEDLNGFIDSVQ